MESAKNYISVESKQISQHTGVSTFASRTIPSTNQNLQKSFHLSHPDKIEFKKISSPSENKKYSTAHPDKTKVEKRSIDNGLQGRTTKTTGYNTGLAKVAVQCSADTLVVNQSLVLRINICGENRHLRQARKRYSQW
jgi:hypothetical protein